MGRAQVAAVLTVFATAVAGAVTGMAPTPSWEAMGPYLKALRDGTRSDADEDGGRPGRGTAVAPTTRATVLAP
ncbi:hypothetical protein [Streptomyces sp. NPDC093225]|uniref:hypothetical protein n=1 Tax=Streptomyces sp. NPDC093225 TaxID=3366034 RepID=UPI00383051E2